MKVVKLTADGEQPLIESGTIIEFDCSEWVKNISDVPIEQWKRVSLASLVKNQLPVASDTTGATNHRHYLELELPVAGPEGEVVRNVEAFIASLSETDVALGGAGLMRNTERSSATTGTVILVLDPVNQAGAEHRLSVIAGLAKAAIEFAGRPVRTAVKSAA